jgi:hypothetical protein
MTLTNVVYINTSIYLHAHTHVCILYTIVNIKCLKYSVQSYYNFSFVSNKSLLDQAVSRFLLITFFFSLNLFLFIGLLLDM